MQHFRFYKLEFQQNNYSSPFNILQLQYLLVFMQFATTGDMAVLNSFVNAIGSYAGSQVSELN